MITIKLKNKHKKYFFLQRNSYLSKSQQKIRNIFGKYLFTNFFVFFLIKFLRLTKD